MRKIIVSNFCTLDGFMAGPNHEIDWFVANDEFIADAIALVNRVDTILFGRITCQEMSGYWPNTPPDDAIGSQMNSTPKVVFSRTLDSVSWGTWDNIRLVKSDAVAEVERLKQQPGGDMVIYGSGGLVSTLMNAELIDDYQVILCPVVLGKGMPFYKDIAQRARLTLTGTHTYKTGTVVLNYAPGQ